MQTTMPAQGDCAAQRRGLPISAVMCLIVGCVALLEILNRDLEVDKPSTILGAVFTTDARRGLDTKQSKG